MRRFFLLLFCAFGSLAFAESESRVFTNTEGQTVRAQLVALTGDRVVLRLASRKIANVPLKSLSEEDQEFIESWWDENGNKLDSMDFVVKIDRDIEVLEMDTKTTVAGGGGGGVRRGCRACPRAGGGGGGRAVRVTKERQRSDKVFYRCELENYAPRRLDEIEVEYTIYKKVTGRTREGSTREMEKIRGNLTIEQLNPRGTSTFQTESVVCEDSSKSGGTEGRQWRRESLEGVVFTFSYGGREFLRQSYPETLLAKVERDEEAGDY